MNYYEREWADRRNAVGFTAECARLALPFYKGDHKPDLVAAIELAERYAINGRSEGMGEDISRAATAAYCAFISASNTSADSDTFPGAAYAAYTAVACAEGTATGRITDTASYVGVDDHEIQAAYARWVVRDLSGGQEPSVLLRQAAGAAVVAGDENLAQEIVNIGRQGAV